MKESKVKASIVGKNILESFEKLHLTSAKKTLTSSHVKLNEPPMKKQKIKEPPEDSSDDVDMPDADTTFPVEVIFTI